MIAKAISHAIQGIDSIRIEVEVDAREANMPSFQIVGLPDAAIRESVNRIQSALASSGFSHLPDKVVVNLAPADVRKEGSALDLPIAVALLGCLGVFKLDILKTHSFVGELGLDGRLRAIPGALSLAMGARKEGLEGFICPEGNVNEAAMAEGVQVLPVEDLSQVVRFLCGQDNIFPHEVNRKSLFEKNQHYEADMREVKGQPHAKRAMEVAAAGGHNILMLGSPGGGKTMLARRLPSILPAMSLEESLETTRIHSIAGLTNGAPLVASRPFRAPHHTASAVALIGGGAIPRPGEVSLAHHGVLFLDEMAELPRSVLEVLRQPLEDGIVTVSRAAMTLTFPARFLLCAAMNPCPCGYLDDPKKECRCSQPQIQKYRSRLSGPLMDRIDLHVEIPPVDFKDLKKQSDGEPSTTIRKRVDACRARQRERLADRQNCFCNAHMGSREIRAFCRLDDQGEQLLERAMHALNLSARSYDRILKVGRTIADLEGAENIQPDHIAEAIQYRTLDRG